MRLHKFTDTRINQLNQLKQKHENRLNQQIYPKPSNTWAYISIGYDSYNVLRNVFLNTYIQIVDDILYNKEEFMNKKAEHYEMLGYIYENIDYNKITALKYYELAMFNGKNEIIKQIISLILECKLNIVAYIFSPRNILYRSELYKYFTYLHDPAFEKLYEFINDKL